MSGRARYQFFEPLGRDVPGSVPVRLHAWRELKVKQQPPLTTPDKDHKTNVERPAAERSVYETRGLVFL